MDIGIIASAFNKKLHIALNVNDLFRSSALAYSYTVNDIAQTFTNFQIIRYFQVSLHYRFGSTSARLVKGCREMRMKKDVYISTT